MTKRIVYGALVTALAVNLLLGARIYRTYAEAAEKDNIYDNIELFMRVLERVRKDYVDGDKLSYQELIYSAMRGMLSTLDPHSEFLDVKKYEELREDTEGTFGGVGLVIGMRDQKLTVVAPMEDTPAFKAGIMTGDQILKINGRSAEKTGLQDAVKQLRGAPGTEVQLTIHRPSSGQVRDVKLTREMIKVETVKDINGKREFPLGDHGIGYVRLAQFGERTSAELEDALKKLEKQGMQSLILDLRGNPGGLLEEAARVCEKFLPRNQLIVSTEGRRADEGSEFRATGRGRHANLPLVVLVNNGSASASEIVAGCLQDTTASGVSRAIIVGEQTFGKGSVQKIIPFQNGAALRLTTAKYYTPSHKVIHEQGITPDIIVPMTDEQEEALFYRSRGGLDALPEEQHQRLGNARDVQLERAMDVLKGIELYTQRFSHSERAATKKAEKATAAR